MLCLLSLLFSACKSSKKSQQTQGWKYNDSKWGGFEKSTKKGQMELFLLLPKSAQEMLRDYVLIEGGTFTRGLTIEGRDSLSFAGPQRYTVNSFFIQKYEVTNEQYSKFAWLPENTIKDVAIESEKGPSWVTTTSVAFDINRWEKEYPYSYSDLLTKNYFSDPSFSNYPVVAVTYYYAEKYCDWLSKTYNDSLLHSTNYSVRFRLPNEAEWEYAALALIGPSRKSKRREYEYDRRMFPWPGPYFAPSPKNDHFLVNIFRGNSSRSKTNSSYGSAITINQNTELNYNCNGGRLIDASTGGVIVDFASDGALYTAPVNSYAPNDYGLYQMAGNVAEWTSTNYMVDIEGYISNLLGYGDGAGLDLETWHLAELQPTFLFDKYDDYKIVKGGSWADPPYYMSAGARRICHPDSCSVTIGFRPVMEIYEK